MLMSPTNLADRPYPSGNFVSAAGRVVTKKRAFNNRTSNIKEAFILDFIGSILILVL